MSWDIELHNDAGYPLPVEKFEEGGTRPLGGSAQSELNVTYNYGEVFSLLGWRIQELDGQLARDTIEKLAELSGRLAAYRPYTADYWAPTPGNAGLVISRLLAWAKQHPDGRWEVR